ncbi:ribosome hibernation factor-recruiting GTPase MRF [Mycolicibacterium bacteremicum]|uniref:ribosome hibernation factor-recruiting GTPase MRF n=1 Tax=Mycolicibacterium bacteremicum TaxID=564198 RepID=UPI0026E9B5FC|nr:GTP-binding protein [Mycolicibacterium bacteremicum]
MRTPVLLVAGQGARTDVVDLLLRTSGTLAVGYATDGHVVIRNVTEMRGAKRIITQWPIELAGGCVTCTIRNDLLILLRRLHRREDVARIVVELMEWVDPEPICTAINEVPVAVGPGYIDGPASRDVVISAVITAVDTASWLSQALGDDDLDGSRTVAQVTVGQAAFADVLVLSEPETDTLAVLRRLAPRSRITVGCDHVETALANLDPQARRGFSDDPHDSLLAGQPPLQPAGQVTLLEFNARRPFHPDRLHLAIDDLLDGVVRVRGRAWLASQPDAVVWIESAGGGLGVGDAGRWLAAMSDNERAYVDPERIALAGTGWDDKFGDRHIALTALLCGAAPETITAALNRALLTDAEMADPDSWSALPDPFGDWHEDPCADLPEGVSVIDEHGTVKGEE